MLLTASQKKILPQALISLQAIICIVTLFLCNGTADSGDSIYHYLFARYAPFHVELYFDHWAKPLFVLLASPFAQFGFTGMKIFNCIVSVLVSWFTYKTAEELKLKNAHIVQLILIFSTLNYIMMFSGYTEPLFALFTVLGIWYALRGKHLTACILVSFLPYIRSEGLIILGVFGIFYLYRRNLKALPWLLTGSLVYAIAGYPVYGDFLWVYTKIPYAKLSSVYGSGPITHFAEQLLYVLGIPIFVLFWSGFLHLGVQGLRKKIGSAEMILLMTAFSIYFAAHSLFWYLGIFNSYGLKRVMIGIVPIIALIALRGYNYLTEELIRNQKAAKVVQVLLIFYIIIFPVMGNPASVQWKKDMMLTPDLVTASEAAEYFLKKGHLQFPVVYSHHYLGMVFRIDPFDTLVHKTVSKKNVAAMKKGDIVIWEEVYAGFETDVKREDLDNDSALKKCFEYKVDHDGPPVSFSGYVKK